MASIVKRGTKQWRVRVRRKGQPPQTRTFDTKFDAERWATSVESKMDRGTFHDQRQAQATTLADALERWSIEILPGLAESTRRTETSRARNLKARGIGRMKLAAIRGPDITDFINERKAEGCKPDTIRLDLALLGRVYVIAARAWGMDGLENPVTKASEARPRIPGGRTRRVSPEEESLLLENASAELKPVIKFALATAMRRGELAELPWSQVQLVRRIATLHDTKNGDSRTVPLSSLALSALEAVPSGKGLVFGMPGSRISKEFTRTVRLAGLDNLHFHDLRHEATSRLFETTNLGDVEIARITGHKTMQMLARYAHLRAENLVDRLG